jgi:hypothetical protein
MGSDLGLSECKVRLKSLRKLLLLCEQVPTLFVGPSFNNACIFLYSYFKSVRGWTSLEFSILWVFILVFKHENNKKKNINLYIKVYTKQVKLYFELKSSPSEMKWSINLYIKVYTTQAKWYFVLKSSPSEMKWNTENKQHENKNLILGCHPLLGDSWLL